MIFEIVTKLKERVRFLTEHRALFNGSHKNNIEKTSSDIQSNDFNDNNVQQTVQETFANQYTAMSNVAYLNEGQYDLSAYDSSINNIDIDEETVGSKQDTNDTEKENKVESKFSDVYILPDLPNKIRQLISTQEIKHFRNHTNSRRLLLDVIFADVTEKYSLRYPNTKQYKSIATAILKGLNITNSDRASSEWIESLKGKFKGERRPLQEISEQVQKMKQKHGNVIGRPLKQNVNEVAARRESQFHFLNVLNVNDDHHDADKHVQLMKTSLAESNGTLESLNISWKKTLTTRRSYVKNHTTAEVLEEYPGYKNISLIFDEILYLCNVNIEQNLASMLPKLLHNVSHLSGFVIDLPSIRLVKRLSKHFTDSWQYILTEKEPLSPRPTIQVRMDKFAIYLDYEFITETISLDQALAIVISLYAIFELQFGAHNRVIHLLYGIFMQQPEVLTKSMRILLSDWNFKIDYKELEPNRLTTSNISVTNKPCERTTTDLLYIETDEADRFVEDEHDESLTERIRNSTTFDEVTIESSVLITSNYRSNESTKYTLCANTDFIAENQTKQSQSSAESLLDDPPLFIDMKSVKRPTFDTVSDCGSSRCSNENEKKRSPTNDKYHEMEVDTYRKLQQLLQEQQENAV
ncbi:unnamed protein product, partial [Rotaria magnacalcarata]